MGSDIVSIKNPPLQEVTMAAAAPTANETTTAEQDFNAEAIVQLDTLEGLDKHASRSSKCTLNKARSLLEKQASRIESLERKHLASLRTAPSATKDQSGQGGNLWSDFMCRLQRGAEDTPCEKSAAPLSRSGSLVAASSCSGAECTDRPTTASGHGDKTCYGKRWDV